MIARLFWPDAHVFEPREDAFWVEFPSAEGLATLVGHPTGLRRVGPAYALVSRSGEVQPMEWVFPFSGQWNGYCPFEAMVSRPLTTLDEVRELVPTPLDQGATPWLPAELRN